MVFKSKIYWGERIDWSFQNVKLQGRIIWNLWVMSKEEIILKAIGSRAIFALTCKFFFRFYKKDSKGIFTAASSSISKQFIQLRLWTQYFNICMHNYFNIYVTNSISKQLDISEQLASVAALWRNGGVDTVIGRYAIIYQSCNKTLGLMRRTAVDSNWAMKITMFYV